MDHASVLALLGNLYGQLLDTQAKLAEAVTENDELREALARTRQPKPTGL